MSTLDAPQAPSPIQRLLIFHLNLAETCLDGKSLGEGASLQELSESIVYYHREGQSVDNTPGYEVQTCNIEEAVQFLGLCTALLSLPASLGDPSLAGDTTNEIYFGNSTLVFAKLEESDHLISVAQISRLYQNGNKSDSGGGNPLAVRASILRCHKLFCMLYGGGVLHRLAARAFGANRRDDEVTSCRYPGMDKLFMLQKELRKASEQLSREGENDFIKSKIDELQNSINILRTSLPIQSIRRDLDSHYRQYLGDLSVVISRNGGATRCIVDTVPIPVPQISGNHVLGSSPSDLRSYVAVTLGLAMRNLLQEFPPNDNNEPYLLGMSTFHHGQLVYSHFSREAISNYQSFGGNDIQATISNELTCLLMGYMASYRIKMKQLVSSNNSVNQPVAPPRLGLKGITLSFGSLVNESTNSHKEKGYDAFHRNDTESAQFLSPPPLFMLSSFDHSYCFEGPSGTKIWAPKVHLPLTVSNATTSDNLSVDTHLISFFQDDFSLLFYIVCDMADDCPKPLPVSFVEKIKEGITAIISEDSPAETSSVSELAGEDPVEPGQDIVHIDRAQHMLTLMTDRKHVIMREKMKKMSSVRSQPRRFLGFSTKSSEADTITTQISPTGTSEWSALGLDCRHLLASHLHLDTILAFDDMMGEIAKKKRIAMQTGNSSLNRTELCTCMPLGWMYALAEGEMELYVFFDSSIYVTVADVQSAALKLRERFFGK